MLFVVIKARDQVVAPVDCPDLRDAQSIAGISNVDHGRVQPGVCIVVYEFGMFMPPRQQSYFAIRDRLYAGNAVLYGVNDGGETIDLPIEKIPMIAFFPGADSVERNIQLGFVERPNLTANGVVVWQWPDPRPF